MALQGTWLGQASKRASSKTKWGLLVLSLAGAVPRHSAWGQFRNESVSNTFTTDGEDSACKADNRVGAVIAPAVPTGISLKAADLVDVPTTSTTASVQTPTTTSASQSTPDTTGTAITTLETTGNPSVQPFPTGQTTSLNSTLSPISTSAPSSNATETGPSTLSTDVSVPTTTLTTVILSTVESSVPVPTVVSGKTTSTLSATSVVIPSTASTVLATTIKSGQVPHITTESDCWDTMGCNGQDIFEPVALGPVPSQIPSRDDHPQPRLGINQTTPIETNKFYSNAFLGSQGSPIFTHPYTLQWAKGTGNALSWGISVSHIDADQKVYGPQSTSVPGNPVSYYVNPLGIQSVIFSAAEMGSDTVMTSDSLEAFSANINLQPSEGSSSKVTFPVVEGMSFVTGEYTSLTPAIQSSIFFNRIEGPFYPKAGIWKYRLYLDDQKQWLMYIMPSDGQTDPNIKLSSSTLVSGNPGFTGTIQIAKNPQAAIQTEAILDASAGVYPTSGKIQGFADGSTASYSLAWDKAGAFASNTSLLMYALSHHVQSFDNTTTSAVTTLQLDTTTKGNATGVIADAWTMVESDLPTNMGFAPWSAGQTMSTLSATAVSVIQPIAAAEVSQDMDKQSNLNSMYYSGKALSKFAQIIFTMSDLSNQKDLATAGLNNLKNAFALFSTNKQQFPLVYDTAWKGVVSSASYVTNDSGVDFGNSYYNDHHFHWGYFLHAAAVIGYLDPSWLADNKDWVNALVRDASNPSGQDTYFPFSRSFDWYHGHSWAKGLFESGDGKDEESSSEDTMFAYGLKMWGKTVGDASMEARGNLMLSVLARALDNYFLLKSDNKNHPANFVPNKNAGIIFENKVDHTTYFGANPEYIQGIHMIPLLPFSAFTRRSDFVTEEWNVYFNDGAVDPASSVVGGWKGILYANLALINAKASWNFFSQSRFDPSWLDGGASQTWYLAMAAGLGGA